MFKHISPYMVIHRENELLLTYFQRCYRTSSRLPSKLHRPWRHFCYAPLLVHGLLGCCCSCYGYVVLKMMMVGSRTSLSGSWVLLLKRRRYKFVRYVYQLRRVIHSSVNLFFLIKYFFRWYLGNKICVWYILCCMADILSNSGFPQFFFHGM